MKRPAQNLLFSVLVVVVAFLTVGSKGTAGLTATPPEPPATQPGMTEACCGEKGNPVGILIGLNTTDRADVVASLGGAYFRPNQALVVDTWDGTCPECDLALQKGLKLILTV